MIVEYVRYRIADPSRRPALESAYARARQQLDDSPHCLSYELAHCHEEPDRYTLRITWYSLERHLNGFRKSPAFKPFVAEVRPFMGDIEEMQHYRVTAIAAAKTQSTICAAVGGVSTFFKLAKRMHEEMRGDEVIGSLFARAAESHVPHLGMWLCEVFGGPKLYSETFGDIGPMLARHAGLDISERQRAAFVACATRAVNAVVAADQQAARQAIVSYIEWGTHVAVANSKPDHIADPIAGVPTWDWNSSA